MRSSAVVVLVAMALAAAMTGPAAAQPDWGQAEAENYARTQQAPTQQATDPAFQARWQEQSAANFLDYTQRQLDDPDWRSDGNLCKEWSEQCTGDPFRYPGVDAFYDDEAVVEPVAFLDRGGARLSGRVWAPRAGSGQLPAVVIINGSVQAPETLYWWGAQALVRAGYVVLTFDPRGQGRSDNRTPDGEPGSNSNPDVFATNLIDAIDFMLSTEDTPYEPNGDDNRTVTEFNPLWERVDQERLGAIGHSLGARGASVVQGVEPWPGTGDANPIDVIVAWDNLALSEGAGGDGLAGFDLVPRVPAMGQAGDYFLTPTPFLSPPDPDEKRQGYLFWTETGVPTYQLNIAGGTHYEWSLLPTFPATAWEPGGEGGWGNPLARHFTVAWMDRWLKAPGEPGYADADARLLDDLEAPEADDLQGGDEPASWCERLSFHFVSSRSFPGRDGTVHATDDIRAECLAALGEADESPATDDSGTDDGDGEPQPPPPASDLPATGWGIPLVAWALVGGSLLLRRA